MKTFKGLLLLALSLLLVNLKNYHVTKIVVAHSANKGTKTEIANTIRGAEYTVVVTMYYAVTGQCDDSPLVTADGSKINPKKASDLKWIAVSQDMLKRNGGKLYYGDYVELKGTKGKDGIYQVHDNF